jgi:ATP-dependent DNA helicase DinG
MYEGNLLDYFPVVGDFKKPRDGQAAVLKEMDRVIKLGKKLIIVEGPVGSGKSGLAIALARAFKSAHIITPRKALQDQYYADFHDYVVLMKGRGGYPCTINSSRATYLKVIQDIENGKVRAPTTHEPNCSVAPCRNSPQVFKDCTNSKGTCPYTAAMEVAQKHNTVIHNLHSFIFQTSFANKFEKREVLVVDEAHDIAATVREFISKKFTIPVVIDPREFPTGNDVDVWCDFFLQPQYVPPETAADAFYKESDDNYVSAHDEYIVKVEHFRAQKTYFENKFVVKSQVNKVGNREISSSFEFIPERLGGAPNEFIFNKGEHVVLMSGTVYGKEYFCSLLGINPEEAHYIRIPSTFPLENRPLVAKPEYQVDTSFANWNENFEEMIMKMEKIMAIFHDAKGLIHAPSYEAAEQIVARIGGARLVTHSKSDTQDKLQAFYDSTEPLVFVSPVCQQGVDFKEDRARFQIIVRVPYPNTSDPFVAHKVKTDFQWYNYQALVVFGQMLGRVNRSEQDYGATFLMDSRFNKFITKNMRTIPKWVTNAIIWK